MWRHLSKPREGYLETVKSQGLVFPMTPTEDGGAVPYWNEAAWYEVTMEEVLKFEAATEELWVMCEAAVQHMATSGDFTDADLCLPEGSMDLIRESLERGDPNIYARFDLAINKDGIPKMLEINGQTPTGLVETAVAQYFWLEDVLPDNDQWNSLHDRLVERWKQLKDEGRFPKNEVHFLHSYQDEAHEEEMTTVYMRDTANAAGLTTYGHAIEDLGWNSETKRFVDWGQKPVHSAFVLYPWEDMLREEFGQHILNRSEGVIKKSPLVTTSDPVHWYNPVWTLLLSTKAILPVLWQLYPNHPNLLPAYFDGPQELPQWVAKPLQGREGDNVRVHIWEDEEDIVNDGGYGDQPLVYQEYVELPEFDGNHLVIGSWVVDGQAAGMICRESGELVTDYYSRVVPHAISDAVQPDQEQVDTWLKERASI